MGVETGRKEGGGSFVLHLPLMFSVAFRMSFTTKDNILGYIFHQRTHLKRSKLYTDSASCQI